MRRASFAAVVWIVAAVGVAGLLLARPSPRRVGEDILEVDPPDGHTPLPPSEASAPRVPPLAPGGAPDPAATTGPPTTPFAVAPTEIGGIVVDGASGEPIEGATVEATSVWIPERSTTSRTARTGADGRFVIEAGDVKRWDLVATAPGRFLRRVQGISRGETSRIELAAGTRVRGRVRRTDGVPIEGARVTADSAEPAAERGQPGQSVLSWARTAPDGSFELAVSSAGIVSFGASHPAYVHGSMRWRDRMQPPPELTLVGALRVWFRLRGSDGRPVVRPTVQWSRTRVSGEPGGVGILELIHADVEGPPPTDDARGPVKIPAEPADGTVRLSIAAPGWKPWASDELPVPAGGAERVLDVSLEPDPDAGSLSVRVVAPDGADVSASRDVRVLASRADGSVGSLSWAYRRNDMGFDGLAAGRWRIYAMHRSFGAVLEEVDVAGGAEGRVELRLGAPVALRVRFTGVPKRRVHFAVERDRQRIPAFVDGPPTNEARTDPAPTHHFAGPEGVVLRGLGPGKHRIVVVAPDLVAEPLTVDLVAGDAPIEAVVPVRAR